MNQHDTLTLEPCPFCGAQPEQCDVGDHVVTCPSCGVDGPYGAPSGVAGAIQGWNRRAALSATQPAAGADVLLDALRDNSWDLVSFDRPTGGDDADIGWRVIEHHMEAPTYRRIAEVFEDDPSAAIRAAIAASGRKS